VCGLARQQMNVPYQLTMDQEVGGSNPPSCTSKIKDLEEGALPIIRCRVTTRVTETKAGSK
jgi:hypothetical protein